MEKLLRLLAMFWAKNTTVVMTMAMTAIAEANPLFWETSPTNSV